VDLDRLYATAWAHGNPFGAACRTPNVAVTLADPDRAFLRELAAGFGKRERALLDCLHAIQDKWGHLPRAALEEFGFEARLAREQVHAAVSFYSNFRLEPPPEVEVLVCETLTCHLAGAPRALTQARAVADAYAPGAWQARGVPCLGLCELAPAMLVQGQASSARNGVEPAIAAARTGKPAPPGLSRHAFAQLHRALAEPGLATREVKASGLRGMGGAGFPAGSKWEFVQRAKGEPKYVVLNADEGEPGTFKDRWLLEREPHRVLEGMLIAMAEVGAERGVIYLREEYAQARACIAQAVEDARAAGLLGQRLMDGRTRSVQLVVGAGSYVCGEETAMLESIEGRRGEPRLKPPYPAQSGLWGQPTLVHNVETLAWVPLILERGAAWWKSQGVAGSEGLKLLSVSGHVARPGVVEVPMGTSFREVFERCGGFPRGVPPKAFVPGGLASGLLPASRLDVRVDFDALAKEGSMLGSGGVVAVPPGTCTVDLAENGLAFFAHESCGKCTPCRVGTEKLLHFCRELRTGKARREQFEVMAELSDAMAAASICGLGQTAMNPLFHGLRHFRDEFEAHLAGRCPESVCR
jgi:NADH:ubiquinone oxidoreductase subunit F (NADH-binding)/NADH:ubiquinone oxidoreductase subunit E